YHHQNQTTILPPPAVCLGEMEMILHCGFTGNMVTGEDYQMDQAAVLRIIQELSNSLSEMMVSSILSTILQNKDDKNSKNSPITALKQEKTLRHNFVTYLGHKLLSYLKTHRAEFININGSIDEDSLIECVLLISDKEFLSHSDLEEVFNKDSSGELRNKIKVNLRASIHLILPRLLAEVSIRRSKQYSSMDVIVSSEELSKMPEECVQTFQLKISPRDLPSQNEIE
ncbi:MAG: hypothetical protein RSA02_02845, partial [Bacteroidales bacterium]